MFMCKEFKTSKDLIDALGRDVVRDHMKCTPTALSNHYVSGKFPSSWWYEMKKLGDAKGVTVPETAFNWREVESKENHTAA